jgi:putative zinc finger/helix-turn-helix YgiT family protein
MNNKKMCPNCGSEDVLISRGEHKFTESGLDNIILKNVEIKKCNNCGEKVVSIPKPNQLLKIIGEQIILNPNRLSPSEIKFLRKNIYLKIKEFAKIMGVTRATVSRWENEHSAPSGPEDRLIRLVYAQYANVDKSTKTHLEEMFRKEISDQIFKSTLSCNIYPELTCQRIKAL